MDKQEAYNIVYNDIMNQNIGLFAGRFDATHGNKNFMYGINTVMELIAFNSSEEDYENFQTIFFENFKKSLDIAKQK